MMHEDPKIAKKITRTRTGCLKCKQRRVKCDERKPICRLCERLKLPCAFPSGSKVTPLSLRPILPAREDGVASHDAAPALPPPQPTDLILKPGEVTDFDHFRNVVIHQMAFEVDGPPQFWLWTVLRESVRDQCVLHGIIALGALSRARLASRTEVPLFSAGALCVGSGSTHYYRAIQYYAQALKKFWSYSAGTRDRSTRRTVLISTMLITAFEVLHGNIEAVDRIGAICLRTLRDNTMAASNHPKKYTSQIAGALDDDGVEEAELWLTRRITLSAISSPIYPRGKQTVLDLVRHFDPGPEPPKGEKDPMAYFRVWCQFFNHPIFWYLRTKHLVSMALSGEVLQTVLKERGRLLQLCVAWNLVTTKHFDQTGHPIYRTILFGIKIIAYCTKCFFDETGVLWDRHRGEWDEVLPICIALRDSVDAAPAENMGLRDALVFALLQISRDCMISEIRFSAINLCKTVLIPLSSLDVRAFVMGTYVVVTAEAEHADENGRILPSVRYDWTSARWDEQHAKLHVTITRRVAEEDAPRLKYLTIDREDWSISVDDSVTG